MPVIVIASPKGGSGKSTCAVLLATEAAHAGIPTILIDCDPNRSVSRWAEKKPLPSNIKLKNECTERTIIKDIESTDVDGNLTIVDLEGIGSLLMTRAISRADLVLTPMKPTQLDAEIGLEAVALIHEQEETFNRTIPHCVVLTMTKFVRSKQHQSIVAGLKSANLEMLDTELVERAAFAGIFTHGGDLYNCPAQGNMEKAIENAGALLSSVLTYMAEKN